VIDPVALEDLKASIAQLGILTPILFSVDAGHCPKPPGAVHQVISDLRFNSCYKKQENGRAQQKMHADLKLWKRVTGHVRPS
jgi:hypothetical protein